MWLLVIENETQRYLDLAMLAERRLSGHAGPMLRQPGLHIRDQRR